MTRTQSFKDFVRHFSKEKLPVTLSEENIHYFDSKNPPLSQENIRRFIKPGEEPDDEYTEYVPCCRIPDTGKIVALVYWRGKMLSYEFILCTYNLNGILIAKKVVAGVKSDGTAVQRSVATIDEDWIISIVVGSQQGNEADYDPKKSEHMSMEILSNGEIVFSLQQ